MTGWDLFWACYIVIGMLITAFSYVGYESLYGKKMPLTYAIVGGILWPIVLLIAGRKK